MADRGDLGGRVSGGLPDPRRRGAVRHWRNVRGGIAVFLVEAAVVIAAGILALAVAATVLWII